MTGNDGRGVVPAAGGGVAQGRGITTVGIVGTGRVGCALARLALDAGLAVVGSGSGPLDRAQAQLDARAPGAVAGTLAEVAAADVVILAIPLGRFRELDPEAFRRSLVVDAMNYWWELDGARPDLDDPTTSTSETVQTHLAGARVVKALNHMSLYELENLAFPPGHPERRGAAIAGDVAEDVQAVATLVDALGFDPVVAGSLADGVRFEPGTEVFGADDDAGEVRAMLDRFWQSQRGRVVGRARGVGEG
ncbi:NAD(P)-binding domain-containing protein [Demequina capsici]|uniref:NAD(P)-binding domain-containing protein n=1 Tax=Demequina capsici TaxID=3075620 RepID=A0AA96FCF7_9MICO|nr:NAD(P)-binding domain-containing protein [Demequina sp. PMTSA13]WNM28296.1 NAD(P)-binding domain-containing protein [Demequina sp. PMTSA13]